jgi:hypothetical protein
MSTTPPSDPRDYEPAARERELSLREREVVAREREVTVKENETKKGRFSNALVVAIVGAIVALVANLIATGITGYITSETERKKAESALFQELIKTDRTTTCTNLKFAKAIRFLRDKESLIDKTCSGDPQGVPNLPQATSLSGADEIEGILAGRVIDADTKAPIQGVEVTPTSTFPTTVKTDANGNFSLVIRGDNADVVFVKPGYVPLPKNLSRLKNNQTILLVMVGH